MTDPDSASAAEHLRVIRNLMERATVYRFISAPVALAGGIATLAASLFQFWQTPDRGVPCLLPWFAALALTIAANAFFMRREARKRQAPLYSPAFRHGLSAILPALTSGLLAGSLSLHWSHFGPGALWSLFYGLALLATRPYAPRSMQILAWFFFVTGLGSLFLIPLPQLDHVRAGSVFMAATFGLYHVAYGLLVGRDTRFRLSRRAP